MPVMNRRQVLCAAAASTAILARIPNARAATYDLLIKGGRVIDPSVGLDGVRDVAIAGGRIAAVEANIMGDATETIDAAGKIVAPGLIDIHTHAGRGKDSPALALQDGVTGLVDAGSGGPDNIDEIATVLRGRHKSAALSSTSRRAPASPAASCWTSTVRTSAWRAARSSAIVTWSSASRPGCRKTSRARTTSKGCGGRRKPPRRSTCR
jgi:hypothetical protein